ncbi:MAG TPA: serine/threonine-protein kinase, partial [Polyangiaceae bacterium]|nr:serine/threonine-protein kinase [Polyangiaceae bacterium]
MSDDIHTPRRIGPYEVLVPIGAGGMASVFLGRVQVVDDVYRPVALKLLHPFLAAEPNVESELLEEARIAASIRHPNVVGVLGVVRDGTSLALVLDYVEGESLAGMLAAFAASNRRLPLHVGLRIVIDALEGLHTAHELRDASGALVNLVHRDFSPQNLLIGIDGRTRLTDFGIAKAAKRGNHTRTGIIKGKIAYMAPEHVRGTPLDRRADVWAAGAVAWEIFAGQKLHRSDDDFAMMMRIVNEPPRSLRALQPDLPRAFVSAVESALERERDKRCATALELRSRLLDAAPMAPAEHAEIGALVRELFEERLDTRRRRMELAVTERSQVVLRRS